MMRIFAVEDYGAVADGSQDCIPAIKRAIEAAGQCAGEKVVKFQTGQYLISDVIEVRNIDNIRIEGCGDSTVLLQSHPKNGGIWVIGCKNVTVSGFAFDMKVMPYCEGIVESIEQNGLILRTSDGFEDVLENGWFQDFGQNFASIVRGQNQEHYHMQAVVWYQSFERLDRKRWKIHLLDDGGMERCGIQPGDGFYLLSRGGQGKNDVYHAANCYNVTFENLIAYAGSSANLTLRNNENVKVDHIAVREKNGRMISTDADGIHASGNRGTFEISHCYFEGMCDDGINVFAYNTDILEVISDTELLMAPGFGGRAGDTIQAVDLTEGRRVKGEAVLAAVEPKEKGVYVALKTPLKNLKAGVTEMRVSDGIEMTVSGDQVFVKEECANLHIHHCYFGRYRGRGIIAHVNAVIDHNIFDNNSAVAIHITEDCDWPEGPVPCNIKVCHNHFVCGSSLPQQPIIAAHWIADDGYLHDISIENNRFYDPVTAPAVLFENAENATFQNNVFGGQVPENLQYVCKGNCTHMHCRV